MHAPAQFRVRLVRVYLQRAQEFSIESVECHERIVGELRRLGQRIERLSPQQPR
jgi:hypothetical protein